VVLTWNGLDDTLECLGSLRHLTTPFALIVADNGSSDGTPDRVTHDFPEAIVLRLGQNLGYAAGNNRGAEAALALGVEYILFLNNDAVMEPDSLDQLLGVMERHANLGILGPLTYQSDSGRIVATGHTWDLWTAGIQSVPLPAVGLPDYLAVDYVWGCGMCVRSTLWSRLGGFDSRYFAYFEDADLCFRAKRLGFETALVPRAVIRHRVSGTANRVFWRQTRLRAVNHLRFFAIHSAPWQRAVAVPIYLGYRLPLFLYASARVYWGLRRKEKHGSKDRP